MPGQKKSFDLAQGASLGLTLGAVLTLFTYLGYRLDQWLGCAPIGVIAGCVLGLGGGMYHVIRKVSDIGQGGEPPPGSKSSESKHDRP